MLSDKLKKIKFFATVVKWLWNSFQQIMLLQYYLRDGQRKARNTCSQLKQLKKKDSNIIILFYD